MFLLQTSVNTPMLQEHSIEISMGGLLQKLQSITFKGNFDLWSMTVQKAKKQLKWIRLSGRLP